MREEMLVRPELRTRQHESFLSRNSPSSVQCLCRYLVVLDVDVSKGFESLLLQHTFEPLSTMKSSTVEFAALLEQDASDNRTHFDLVRYQDMKNITCWSLAWIFLLYETNVWLNIKLSLSFSFCFHMMPRPFQQTTGGSSRRPNVWVSCLYLHLSFLHQTPCKRYTLKCNIVIFTACGLHLSTPRKWF